MLLNEYVEALTKRAIDYKEAETYYEGRVSEQFASQRLRHAMRVTGHAGQHNYCRVVVDAVLNRLSVANIVGATQTATNKVTEVWDENDLHLEANEIHRGALTYGDFYAIVWPDEDGKWLISPNSPRTTALVYDPENPKKKLYAVKVWQQDENTVRLNVYWPDRIDKYSAQGTEFNVGTQWSGIGSEENPFNEVPVFHFRTKRQYGKPEHLEAYGPQNDINKLLATHFFSIDYQGAPQRYALSMQGESDVVDFGDDETDRENIASLNSEPGSLWYLKGIHGVGQFNPADPDVFWKPISNLKQSLAALTDTPFHYLERSMTLSSGQAYRAAEAGLQKKVADRQVSFGVAWRELFDFILRVEGIKARLEVKWEAVESFDQLDVWDVMLKKRNAGLSMRQVFREAGYEEADIERIMAERLEEIEMDGNTSYGRSAVVRTSTDDNETFGDRNGLTEGAKVNGGRGESE